MDNAGNIGKKKINFEVKFIPSIKVYQFVSLSNMTPDSIRWDLTLIVYNNNTNSLTFDVIPDPVFGNSVSVSSLSPGATTEIFYSKTFTRTSDAQITVSPAVLNGEAYGASNSLNIIVPGLSA